MTEIKSLEERMNANPREFTPVEIQLLNLKDELYVGSWERMITNLNERLNTRPYVHGITTRISKDLVLIEQLRIYEAKYGVNLSDCLEAPATA